MTKQTPKAAGANPESLESLLAKAEQLIDDPTHDERVSALSQLAKELGDVDSAEEIIETGKRIRTQLRLAMVGYRKATASKAEADAGLLESAKQNTLEALAQEEALSLVISKALSASIFLTEEGGESRLYTFTFDAPAYLASMVKAIKAEMKAKTGRPVQDYQAIRAAILFALTRADEFLVSSMVVGPSQALSHRGGRVQQPKGGV